jgi:hypothetical protein
VFGNEWFKIVYKWFFVFYVGTIKTYEFDGCRPYMKHLSRSKFSSAFTSRTKHKFVFIICGKYQNICKPTKRKKQQDTKFSAPLDVLS